jgi:hypothetical protein
MFRTYKAPGGARGPAALPRAALRGTIIRCAQRLRHAAELAELAATGDELEHGAEHLVATVTEIRSDLALLTAAARSISS